MVETNDLIHTAEDDQAEMLELVAKYRINAADKFDEKAYLLEKDGVPFSPRGNLCAVAAEKKAGKTWFLTALAAASTKGEFLGMRAREEAIRVLWFDTEQDKGDGQKIQRRVHFANGWDFETNNDRFMIFHLREEAPEERRRIVANLMTFLKADLVVVDGVRDLMKDFNDVDQTQSIIEEHMRLSSLLNCCIWEALHVNPGSEKMRGHLGTELGNKLADLIFMTKIENPDDEDDVRYKAKETDARGHKNIHSMTFKIDDNQPFGIPVIVGNDELKQIETSELEQLREDMRAVIPDARVYSKTSIRDALKGMKGIGSTSADRMLENAVRNKIVDAVNTPHGIRYRFNNSPLPTQKEMPFDQTEPNEEVPY